MLKKFQGKKNNSGEHRAMSPLLGGHSM